jgi:hypothetical protein
MIPEIILFPMDRFSFNAAYSSLPVPNISIILLLDLPNLPQKQSKPL